MQSRTRKFELDTEKTMKVDKGMSIRDTKVQRGNACNRPEHENSYRTCPKSPESLPTTDKNKKKPVCLSESTTLDSCSNYRQWDECCSRDSCRSRVELFAWKFHSWRKTEGGWRWSSCLLTLFSFSGLNSDQSFDVRARSPTLSCKWFKWVRAQFAAIPALCPSQFTRLCLSREREQLENIKSNQSNPTTLERKQRKSYEEI